jgi:hypothetical protein
MTPAIRKTNEVARQEFGSSEIQSRAETAVAAVAARQQAEINAMFIMAERHPRVWMAVRSRLLDHCRRPGFAEIARYKKPTGKKKIDGRWVDTFAEGLSARFAEIARSEMGNVRSIAEAIYEDDLIRIVRTSVSDLEHNTHDYRDVVIAKAVEKRGTFDKATKEWTPPEGRDIISQRVNSYGDPVWLVKATDDEVQIRQNSLISKAQRDESLRQIPKDIRDDCEAQILATLNDPKAVDPKAALKKICDAFAGLSRDVTDLEKYLGTKLEKASPSQIDELRGLFVAIRDGEITFDEAIERKYEAAGSVNDAERVAEEKIEELKRQGAQVNEVKQQTQTATETRTEPASDLPPADLVDLPDWPEVLGENVWIKVKGEIFKLNEEAGNYQKWTDPRTPGPKTVPRFGRAK